MTKGEKSGFVTLNFDWLYWPLFAMNGVELLTPDGKKAAFNTPAAVEDARGAGPRRPRSGAINKVSWTGRWVETNGAFASGTVGLYQAHAPAFFYVRGGGKWVNADTLGVAQMPGGYATPNSHGFGISKSSKHPDLAWDFVKLITNEKWAYTFGTTRFKNLTGAPRRSTSSILRALPEGGPAGGRGAPDPGREPRQLVGHLAPGQGRRRSRRRSTPRSRRRCSAGRRRPRRSPRPSGKVNRLLR